MAEDLCQTLGRQQGHLAFDQAGRPQALHPAQAGGRRDVQVERQLLIGSGRIALQLVEQSQIDVVQ